MQTIHSQRRLLLAVFLLTAHLSFLTAGAHPSAASPSTAGDGGRLVWNFNPGWRFHLGDVAGAEATDFDDHQWQVVTTPHTVQLMPAEASGCRNYQGVAWYRKHFVIPEAAKGRVVTLTFEAIMGKQWIYVNGREVKYHEGGYLPVTIDLTAQGYEAGSELVVAVKADNSDDKTYPPGKTQLTLDFAYHGGIYRDVWLTAKSRVAITDALEEGQVAGGGIFVHYDNISEARAEVFVNTHIRNTDTRPHTVIVENLLGQTVSTKVSLQPGQDRTVVQKLIVKHPRLWSPESPTLYNIRTRVREGRRLLDEETTRVGIRSIEFRPVDGSAAPGFYLNGRRYHQLVGANRHQDFAYVGNALPNSQQWRDAKRLKDAGFNIIRTAHYPQDPAFMDACDELGLFIIVATPGWQFWNKMEGWADKVQQNTRLIIRRDRNHPCVLMWEPILNETRFPEQFALDALQITRDEYPYPYRPVAAADVHSAGVKDHYDVVYGWPGDDYKSDEAARKGNTDAVVRQPIFTREFGELVDDWYAHNNLNRASRSWGERPMLMQAMSLLRSTGELFHTTGQFIGGCQWHPFDHQRGYHPDPYWGGIYDAFRQPKTALPMFQAALTPISGQTSAGCHDASEGGVEGAFLYIAHEMTQFSEADVTVFSNCDSVRLTLYDGEHCWTQPVIRVTDDLRQVSADALRAGGGYAVFKDAWNFFEARDHSYTRKSWQSVKMVAEGIVDGQVVCREEKMPSRRSTKLRLRVDDLGRQLVADGSDFVVVVCEVTDDLGHVRRLAKEQVLFTVEGEGTLIGDAAIGANPRTVEWGSAPALVRSTLRPGKIKIRAEVLYPGTHAPTPAELEIESVPYGRPMCYMERETAAARMATAGQADGVSGAASTLSEQEKARLLQEVQEQQADFGIQR